MHYFSTGKMLFALLQTSWWMNREENQSAQIPLYPTTAWVPTWHKLSPPRHTRTHSWSWSGSRWADCGVWAGGHRSPHPATDQNARTGSGRFPRSSRVSQGSTPAPSSLGWPKKEEAYILKLSLFLLGLTLILALIQTISKTRKSMRGMDLLTVCWGQILDLVLPMQTRLTCTGIA